MVSRTRKTQPQKPSESSDKRVIKKYPNRRLYDTSTSSYVTLSEVKDLVLSAQDIQVVDSKNGDDLTRSILLQIILEEETAGVPMFSQAALVNIIRFYGQLMHGFMGTYLEKNMQSIMDLQVQMSGHKKPLPTETWQSLMAMGTPVAQSLVQAYSESSREAFDKMQEQLQEQMQAQTNQMLESLRIKPIK